MRRALAAGIDVAYLPGIAANRASSLFPGDAKIDERDTEVITRTAMGVLQALRPVPAQGALEGARRLEAQRCDLLRDRTPCVNRLRALLLESNLAFERELDCEPRGRSRSCRAWTARDRCWAPGGSATRH